jgi:hypothetical protein
VFLAHADLAHPSSSSNRTVSSLLVGSTIRSSTRARNASSDTC